MKTKLTRLIVLFSLISLSNYAQNSSLERTIKKHDSIFWSGYNSCDRAIFKKYITDDFEFFHDKGGLTSGAGAFLKLVDENLCNKSNTWSLRREVVEGSVQIFPLNNYGAIIRGEHVFYLKEYEGKEKLIEKARFTHVWKVNQGVWKMSRVLSFDHQPTFENTDKKEVTLTDKELKNIAGNYKAPKTGDVVISIEDGKLMMSAGQMKAQLFAESKTLFFMKQAPLTFEFVVNEKGLVQKMIVREQGNIAEEAIKQ